MAVCLDRSEASESSISQLRVQVALYNNLLVHGPCPLDSATCNMEVQGKSVIYGDSVPSSMESTSVEARVLN